MRMRLLVVAIFLLGLPAGIGLPAGRIESSQREFTLHTDTGLYTPSDFRQLVVGPPPV